MLGEAGSVPLVITRAKPVLPYNSALLRPRSLVLCACEMRRSALGAARTVGMALSSYSCRMMAWWHDKNGPLGWASAESRLKEISAIQVRQFVRRSKKGGAGLRRSQKEKKREEP